MGLRSALVFGALGCALVVAGIALIYPPAALIAAGLALRSGDDVIAGIDVSCELSGPTPFRKAKRTRATTSTTRATRGSR